MPHIFVHRVPSETLEDAFDRIKARLVELGHETTEWLTTAHIVATHTINVEGATEPIMCHATESGAEPVYRVGTPDLVVKRGPGRPKKTA